MRFVTIIPVLLMQIACQKIQSYPDTPHIAFKEFSYQDTSLYFSFVDGDGNFGFLIDELTEKDTTDSAFNVFAPLEILDDSEYVPFNDIKNWRYHISGIPQPQGQNKTQKGEIRLRFYTLFDTASGSYALMPDSFRFRFWIKDNNYNISNIDSTPVLYKALIGI